MAFLGFQLLSHRFTEKIKSSALSSLIHIVKTFILKKHYHIHMMQAPTGQVIKVRGRLRHTSSEINYSLGGLNNRRLFKSIPLAHVTTLAKRP